LFIYSSVFKVLVDIETIYTGLCRIRLGVCLKFKLSAAILTIVLLSSTMTMLNYALVSAATTEQTPAPTPTATTIKRPLFFTAGYGWINNYQQRDDFRFYIEKGNLRPDGWRYNPNGQVNFTGRDFKNNQVIHVWSAKEWRFKILNLTNGKEAVIAGTAIVKIGENVRFNWWFRVTVRDGISGPDAFMIQLWRPTGANTAGGWSPLAFNPMQPGTLHLNQTAFYEAHGILKSGNILIKPIIIK